MFKLTNYGIMAGIVIFIGLSKDKNHFLYCSNL